MTSVSPRSAMASILSRASQHPDGVAAPPASLPPAPRAALAQALLKVGLLEPTDQRGAPEHPGLLRRPIRT